MFQIGDAVKWAWYSGFVEGEVVNIFKEKITLEIKGKMITRNGSPEKPAYLVKSKAGNLALKLQTEISKLELDLDF